MKFPRRVRDPVEINLAPLLDVIFILLLFFVVSTTFSRETHLQLDLPQAGSGQPAPPEQEQALEITIDAAGGYRLNQRVLDDAAALEQALSARQISRQQVLLISADARTAHQSVVTAMDLAVRQGFRRVRVTTVQQESLR